MPKSASQNALIKEKRKNQIMETALKLFANYGIDNVTVDNISQTMKISHGLFYHYFEDKEDLVNALITKAKEIFIETLKEIATVDDNSDTLTLISRITESAILTIDKSESSAYYLYLVLCLDFDSDRNGREFTAHFKNYLFNLFRKGQEEGILKDISDIELVTIYLCALQGIAYRKLKYKKAKEELPSAQSIVNLLLK